MRATVPRYPVDRYLVESSKKFEIVNITDDETSNAEPTLKPEDEIVLRKLHEMLQSTADDLKLLSGELSKFHEPGVQVKTQPTPLDEDFNEKVHIEEIVNAKFHGYKIVDEPLLSSRDFKTKEVGHLKSPMNILLKPNVNTGVQVNSARTKSLGMTRTRIVEIKDKGKDVAKPKKLNNGKVIEHLPAVAYNEFSYKYEEPKDEVNVKSNLKVQNMPQISINRALVEQKVLQLDILPENMVNKQNVSNQNVAVITIEHENKPLDSCDYISHPVRPINVSNKSNIQFNSMSHKSNIHLKPHQNLSQTISSHAPKRKVFKMSTYESSASSTNVNSDTQHNLKTQKQIKTVIRLSPKNSTRIDRSKNKKLTVQRKEADGRPLSNIEDWKKKLNIVYNTSKRNNNKGSKSNIKRVSPKRTNVVSDRHVNKQSKVLNNSEYIPYSQLTLGGVRASDIEREISDIPNKNDLPLSPILDKLLNSRENSFQKDARKEKDSSKILTTSDENLLQEVIDIEKTIMKTLTKNEKKKSKDESIRKGSSSRSDSYADDFEDENSDDSARPEKKTGCKQSEELPSISDVNISDDDDDVHSKDNDGIDTDCSTSGKSQRTIHDATFTKGSNLSFKKSVDVFEFVHAVDTQETATQSNTGYKLSLKETQTSPTNENQNIRPIHNDLWPSIDPRGEVEKMFKLERDFIKKLIMDEYGDLFEKSINKPSTSKDCIATDNTDKNIASYQKNTQTSPAHVKSIMTSPAKTKTRTTSPLVPQTIDHTTSPFVPATNEEELNMEENTDEEHISVNLSSSRFNLRLPQTSREVLSNLDASSTAYIKNIRNNIKIKTSNTTPQSIYRSKGTSSSADADNSSSELSSLGEVKLKLSRKVKKTRIHSTSVSSSCSSSSKYSSDIQFDSILPLRSEGEVSVGQVKKNIKSSKSEGETSIGQVLKR